MHHHLSGLSLTLILRSCAQSPYPTSTYTPALYAENISKVKVEMSTKIRLANELMRYNKEEFLEDVESHCHLPFLGRGKNTHAYTHSVQAFHHVFLNLKTLKVLIMFHLSIFH